MVFRSAPWCTSVPFYMMYQPKKEKKMGEVMMYCMANRLMIRPGLWNRALCLNPTKDNSSAITPMTTNSH